MEINSLWPGHQPKSLTEILQCTFIPFPDSISNTEAETPLKQDYTLKHVFLLHDPKPSKNNGSLSIDYSRLCIRPTVQKITIANIFEGFVQLPFLVSLCFYRVQFSTTEGTCKFIFKCIYYFDLKPFLSQPSESCVDLGTSTAFRFWSIF